MSEIPERIRTIVEAMIAAIDEDEVYVGGTDDPRSITIDGHVDFVALADAALRREWQPIETAPTGKDILLAWPRGSTGAFPNPTIGSRMFSTEPWIIAITGQKAGGSYAPTLWMPLPEPPNKEI